MNVKSLVLGIALAVLASPAARAQSATTATQLSPGDIDGIWAMQSATAQQLRDASYFSIRASNDGLLVIIRLGTYEWQAYVTMLSGNSATVVTITTQAINSWRIDFASAQKATITGLTCIPNGSSGGPMPLGASPSVASAAAGSATTDVSGMPIYLGNRCLVQQGATLALSKVL